MKGRRLALAGVVVGLILTAIVSGCGGGMVVTYQVDGSAAEAAVSYKDAAREMQSLDVALPWETTIKAGEEFAFELEAVNLSDGGTLRCAVVVDGDTLGDMEGRRSVGCSGDVRKSGSSTTSSFRGSADAVVQEHIDRGIDYAEDGDLEAAIAEFEEAIALNPESVNAHGNLGIACVQLERFEEGIAAYQEALKLDPEHADLHYNLGLAYRKAGRPDDAVTAYERAVELAPDMFDAHKNLGLVHADEGRTEEAITALERYLEVRPDAPDRTEVEQDIAELREQLQSLGSTCRNEAGGYAIRYPDGWYEIQKGAETSLAPSQEDYGAPTLSSPLITLFTWPLAETTANLGLQAGAGPEDYLEVFAQRLDAELDESGTGELGGYPAALGATSGVLRGATYDGNLAIVVTEDRLFLAEALALPEQWSDFHTTFGEMLKSLSFFTPEAVYRNERGGYAVRPPQGWKYREAGANVTFVEEEADFEKGMGEAPRVIVSAGQVSEIVPGAGADESADARAIVATMAELFVGAGEIEDTTVAGRPAAIADVSDVVDGVMCRGRQAAVVLGERYVYVLGLASMEVWDEMSPVYDELLASLSVGE